MRPAPYIRIALPRLFKLPTRRALFVFTGLIAALLLSGCGLVGDDEDDPAQDGTGGEGIADILVIDSAMSTQIDENKQASGVVGNAFPPDTQQIYIVLVLDGVDVGTVITGRWFQLVDAGPPGGTEISRADVTLTQDNVIEGAARVELNLSAGASGFPPDDYVVRVYAGDTFIKTSAFVISELVTHPTPTGAPPSAAAPDPTATPGTAAPQPTATPGQQAAATATQAPAQPTATPTQEQQGTPENYTVVSGDTLTIIAERFKSDTESTESYIVRLQQENDLQPGSILFVGQVLELPGPQ
jgi:hypothetical protein